MDLHFTSHQPNKNIALIGLIFFVFGISLVIGILFSQKNGKATTAIPNTKMSQGPVAGTTQLVIKANANRFRRGESTQVLVQLAGAPVQATDIVITYDPKVVKLTDIVNGEVFPDILRSDIGPRSLTVSAAVDPNAPTTLHTGTLFSFTLQGVAAGTTTLAFDTTLTITATNGTNTLGTAAATTVTVE